jgi:ubiquinone/menaquinone biosynthesis C-methylase UbiE
VDLRDRLPFDNETFDDVVASLVLHHLEDWGPTLRELRRVLRPGGRPIVSVKYSAIAHMLQDPLPNYSTKNSYSFDWTLGGHIAPMISWRRPCTR